MNFTKTLRMISRRRYQLLRAFFYFVCKFWLRKVIHAELLPQAGPVIIVSNHLSYYDWSVLSSIYGKKYIVFFSKYDLCGRFFVNFLIRFNILIYIDDKKNKIGYFKEALMRLNRGEILVIYPEGARSKTGKMMEPKSGFVQLALHSGAPIVPIGMKGTFEILPPQGRFPAFKRCDVVVGNSIVISEDNELFRSILLKESNKRRISSVAEEKIAVIIMNKIAEMVGQDWEEEVIKKYPDLLKKRVA